MKKKYRAYICILVFLNFLVGCAKSYSPPVSIPAEKFSGDLYIAKKMPEVHISTTGNGINKGKIVSLGKAHLKLQPFPYWNLELLEIPLAEIRSIRLKKKSDIGKATAAGFGSSFVLFGTIGILSSQYNEDYEAALLGSVIVSTAVGLIAFTLSGISKAAEKSTYELHKMNLTQKQKVVKKIMGIKKID
jgi:hypothetical protein